MAKKTRTRTTKPFPATIRIALPKRYRRPDLQADPLSSAVAHMVEAKRRAMVDQPAPPVEPPPPALPSAVAFVEHSVEETIDAIRGLRSRLESAGLLSMPMGGESSSQKGQVPTPLLLSTRLEDAAQALHRVLGEVLSDINARLQV